MNRRDQNVSNQQGGYRNEDNSWESPRQPSQWSESGRQAGGGLDSDDNQRPAYWDDEEQRERGRSVESRYGGRQREDWQDRDYTGASPGARNREDFSRDQGGLSSGFRRAYGEADRAGGYREDRRYQSRGAHLPHSYDASAGNAFSSFTSEDYGGRDFSNRTGGGYGTFGAYGHSSESYRPAYGPGSISWFGSGTQDEYGSWRHYGESRGFLQRAGDEIASWFGDEDAARRREQDHRGRGPSDYTRSDERIREDVNDRLTHDGRVDATNIRVSVKDGEISLDGTVSSRQAKRRAEDVADEISGVKHVQNNLRVQETSQISGTGRLGSSGAGSTGSYSSEAGASTSSASGSAARSSDKAN